MRSLLPLLRPRARLLLLNLALLAGIAAPALGRAAGEKEEAPPAAAYETTNDIGQRALDKLLELKKCPGAETGQFDAKCALPVLEEAGDILRKGGIGPDDSPKVWWTILEELGLTFARLQKFDKAKEFFQDAGRIHRAGLDAREETAYHLAAIEYELGNTDRAIESFHVLFAQNGVWVGRALEDPTLARIRKTPQWKKVIAPLVEAWQAQQAVGAQQSGQ